jgi:hypothetical protein
MFIVGHVSLSSTCLFSILTSETSRHVNETLLFLYGEKGKRSRENDLLQGAGQAGFLENQPSLNMNSGLNKGKTNRLTSLFVEWTSQQVYMVSN